MENLKDQKKLRKKALVIVAHPDDESIFMGGTISEFKKWNWTILCVTDCDERYNMRRRKEFLKAVQVYSRNGSYVEPMMLGMVKEKRQLLKKELKYKIKDVINEFGPFDIIFTHNSKGDYGHKTHKLINHIVRELRIPNVYNFFIESNKTPGFKMPGKKFLRYLQAVHLSRASRRTKKEAINIYFKGSQKTNLLRLKRLLAYSITANTELFCIN